MNDIYYGDSNDNAENPPVWQVNSGSNGTICMENMGVLEQQLGGSESRRRYTRILQ